MKYRPEIDGLRALAVMPVVFFHAGLAAFPGGFVGVDVFFVISGYLITKIIVDQLSSGSFSLTAFYQRRILRIFPALFAMVGAALFASSRLLLPPEFMETGKSTVATALFISNFFFWNSTDYFSGTGLKPLLHTWSLAVEEQFYAFFPLMLYAIWRWARCRLRFWIWATVASSFVLSAILIIHHQATTFYFLPTRAWELGIGALIAVNAFPAISGKYRSVSALIGAALILFAVFFLSESNRFPSWNALYPCIGAALIILHSEGTFAGRVLSATPIRFVGKISYSLYLWHWPTIVFYSALHPEASVTRSCAVIAISMTFAVVSFFFVERPFRFRGPTPPLRTITAGVAILSAFITCGVTVATLGPQLQNLPGGVVRASLYVNYRETDDYRRQYRRGRCFAAQNETFDENCLTLDPHRPNYILLGDSHAAQYWGALSTAMPSANFIQATVTGCRAGLYKDPRTDCKAFMNRVLQLAISSKLDGVILAGRWQRSDIPALAAALQLLNNAKVRSVVVGPTVEYQSDLPALLARERLLHRDDRQVGAYLKPAPFAINTEISALVKSTPSVTFADVIGVTCQNQKQCTATSPDGGPMTFDYGHLTLDGAAFVVSATGMEDMLTMADPHARKATTSQ